MHITCIYVDLRINDWITICNVSADCLVVAMVKIQNGTRVFRIMIETLYHLRENFGLGASKASFALKIHQNRVATGAQVAITVHKRLLAKQKITRANSLGSKKPSSSSRGIADLDGH